MHYYLSGPMSGYPEYNFPVFQAACAYLRAQGLHVTSPHEKGSEGDTRRSWSDYLREDIHLLLTCDAIILLPGWTTSKGARLELEIALDLGMEVYFLAADARGLCKMSQAAPTVATTA